tara:strand:- start:570 stop:743 length:174 start_codon:yes stop_codon:yes gene_type:complete
VSVTVTVLRGEEAITVVVDAGVVVEALDEGGGLVALTDTEKDRAVILACAGVDETGR